MVQEAQRSSRLAARCDGWPECGCPNEATETILGFALCAACARAFVAPDPDYVPVGAAHAGCPDCDPMSIIELLGEPARPACPWCSSTTHAPGRCPVAAALTGAPLIAGLKQELVWARAETERAQKEIDAYRAVVDDACKRYSYLFDGWRNAASNEEIADVVRKAMFNWEETRRGLYETVLR